MSHQLSLKKLYLWFFGIITGLCFKFFLNKIQNFILYIYILFNVINIKYIIN
jgi:hypothetical protein